MTIADPCITHPDRRSSDNPARQKLRVAGHELTVFDESPPMLDAMVQDIRAAETRVWMESYIFADDAAGQAISAALCDRAKQGLDVRLMYDAIGCIATPATFFANLSQAGVQVHAYHTLREAVQKLAFLQILNRRNHRKLLVIDDKVAYFGGMNIVDQRGITNPEDAKARKLPASAGWRDVHVRMVGPQQRIVAAACDRLWQRVHGKEVKSWPRWPVKQMLAAAAPSIAFFDCRPTLRYHRASRVLVPLIRQATQSITLSMAYFIPQGGVLRELLRARKRGVTIRVIVPGTSDVAAVQHATRYFYASLLKRGIRIYERDDCMLHSKVMIIDQEWTVAGSCNLDPRSLRLNLEFFAVIRDRGMATAVKRICHFEMQHSRRVTMAECRTRGWKQRLLDRVAWSFRRWL